MHLLAIIATALAVVGSPTESNVAPCDKAIIGHGSADWRGESVVAGPVGVRRHPLSAMSPTRNGFVTKMPLLVEDREPETVTVSVPPPLRNRVFLYYGRIIGRDGQPAFTFADAHGYGEVEFRPCGNKPRTIWPGGIRVKGDEPVRLLVTPAGESGALLLRLGRPQAYEPSRR